MVVYLTTIGISLLSSDTGTPDDILCLCREGPASLRGLVFVPRRRDWIGAILHQNKETVTLPSRSNRRQENTGDSVNNTVYASYRFPMMIEIS